MMTHTHKKQPDEKQYFFDKPENVERVLKYFYRTCVLLVLVDFVVHRHILTAAENIPAFYAIYGFIACVALVLMATSMRKVVMRDKDYYTEEEKQGHEDKGKQ